MTNAPSQHHSLLSLAKDALLAAGILDINEPDSGFNGRFDGRSTRIILANGTPAIVYLGRCYKNEWAVSIALWPTDNAELNMSYAAGGALAGEVFAWGWLNRWQFDGRAIGIERFHNSRGYVAVTRKSEATKVLNDYHAMV